MWDANRNFTKVIVKAFPAYRRGVRKQDRSSGRPEFSGGPVERRTTALERIRKKDSDRRRLLKSPLRWFLVLALGCGLMVTLADSQRVGMTSVFLAAVLWGAAFSRLLTFRVMCSGILLTSIAAFALYGVDILRIAAMSTLALGLMILALRSLPESRKPPPAVV